MLLQFEQTQTLPSSDLGILFNVLPSSIYVLGIN